MIHYAFSTTIRRAHFGSNLGHPSGTFILKFSACCENIVCDIYKFLFQWNSSNLSTDIVTILFLSK
jgi:hypothetical protein